MVKKRTRNSRKAIAANISALLLNPDTPADLHNAMIDVITDMSNALHDNSPAYIESVLTAYDRHGDRIIERFDGDGVSVTISEIGGVQ
jgi:hypothetical protein